MGKLKVQWETGETEHGNGYCLTATYKGHALELAGNKDNAAGGGYLGYVDNKFVGWGKRKADVHKLMKDYADTGINYLV